MQKKPYSHTNNNYQRIWKTVQLIPYGNVACYGQVADLAGLPGRARLVGKALAMAAIDGWQGKSIPWFRVINSQGKISFANGSDNFTRQKFALQEEGVIVLGSRIKLKDYQWQPTLAEILNDLEF